MTRWKVCCIASPEEARAAIARGASLLGLVSAMPSGPGPIPEERIAAIARTVPPGVTSVLLTSLGDAAAIAAQQARCGTGAVQVVEALPDGELPRLRRLLPAGVSLLQVVHVRGAESLEEARAAAEHADALLLDSGDPRGAVKELGGTGRVHDWSISRRIVEAVARPVFLAGGLGAHNLARALAEVRPFGVDVCSGLRSDGALDPVKLDAFAAVLRAAGGGA